MLIGNYENTSLRSNYELNTPTHCSLRLVLSSFVLHNGYKPITTMTRHVTDRSILTPQRVQYIVTLADDMSMLFVNHHTNVVDGPAKIADKKSSIKYFRIFLLDCYVIHIVRTIISLETMQLMSCLFLHKKRKQNLYLVQFLTMYIKCGLLCIQNLMTVMREVNLSTLVSIIWYFEYTSIAMSQLTILFS